MQVSPDAPLSRPRSGPPRPRVNRVNRDGDELMAAALDRLLTTTRSVDH